jgi:micrococcal nuclease
MIKGKVLKIIDGDTIDFVPEYHSSTEIQNSVATHVRIRLAIIDAPESKQQFGAQATQHLRELLEKYHMVVQVRKTTQRKSYGRWVAEVFAGDETNINKQMVLDGYAVVYPKFYNPQKILSNGDNQDYDYEINQQRAQQNKRGIWKFGDFQMPWEYRQQHRRKPTKSNLITSSNKPVIMRG